MKIFIMDYNNKTIDKSFIIYDDKLVKWKPKKINGKPNHSDYNFHYYTQEEIDKSPLHDYLKIIDNRLTDINDNLNKGIDERLAN